MLVLRSLAVLAVLTASGASAQNLLGARAGGAATGGITVLGRATVAAVPDRARVTVQIFGNTGPANANATSLDDAANALRDTLRANGVADAREVLPIGNFSTRNVVPAIVGSVEKPTRDRLEEIARNVAKALPDRYAASFANAQIVVALIVDDCDAAEMRAEHAAFVDAKARATRLAAAAGVRLGAVTAIGDTQTFLPPGCAAKPDAIDTTQTSNPQNVSWYAPLAVPITVNEAVTFAIANP